jgi:hypothetical protein
MKTMNAKKRLAWCLALAAAAACVARAGQFDAWNYHAELTFTGYDGTGTLTAFPTLVSMTNFPGFSYSQLADVNGGDLRFTDAAGEIELNYEIDTWNPAGASFVWVQVPALAGAATSIRAYWGNPAATSPVYTTDGSAWSNGYAAVYHLGEKSGTVLDATANGNNSSSVAGDVARGRTGAVGGACVFDGSGDYISIPDSASLDGMSKLTVEALALDQDGSTTAVRAILSKRLSASNGQRSYYFYRQEGRDLYAYVNDTGGRFSGSVSPTGEWHHLAFTFDASLANNELKAYADGTLKGQMNNGAASVLNRDDPLLIGRLNGSTSSDWKGLLDEVRISNVARSAEWLRASWRTAAENTAFCTYGETLVTALPYVRTDLATAVTTNGATLNGTLESSPSEAVVTVFWGRTDSGTNAAVWEASHDFPPYAESLPAAFVHEVTGLAADVTWHVRHRAVNAAGARWSPATTAFITGEIVVEATVATANEAGSGAGIFTVRRPAGAETLDTVVAYEVAGTATPGGDYAVLSGSVTIPAGQTSATIEVAPVSDFALEGEETVVVTLLPGLYALGTATQAVVTITDFLPPATGTTNVWIGSGNAGVAANWSLGHVPTAPEDILLTGFSVADMTWDAGVNGLSTNVASWTQDTNYTGNVFVDTPFAATDPILVVAGDVVLDGGAWMHTGNQTTETTKLFARVNGDLMIGANASINVFAKGFRGTSGPGYVAGGSAHGGEGATMNSWTKTYGSVFRPDRWGSGGGKTGYPGGGLAQLEVGGALTVNGSINANGHGVYNNNGAGGGGSILLTVGSLEGGGTISADGGLDDWSGNGGGGRVAIYLQNAGASRSQFAGSVSARGVGNQKYNQGSYESGCGTVYWQTVQDGEGGGTVYVWNPLMLNRTSTVRRSCHLPPALGTTENFGRSHWVIQENAHLKLMDDARVASLTIAPSSNPLALGKLNLNNRTLRTKALTILGTSYPAGTYAAADFPEGRVIDGSGETPGQVVVLATGTILTVR